MTCRVLASSGQGDCRIVIRPALSTHRDKVPVRVVTVVAADAGTLAPSAGCGTSADSDSGSDSGWTAPLSVAGGAATEAAVGLAGICVADLRECPAQTSAASKSTQMTRKVVRFMRRECRRLDRTAIATVNDSVALQEIPTTASCCRQCCPSKSYYAATRPKIPHRAPSPETPDIRHPSRSSIRQIASRIAPDASLGL